MKIIINNEIRSKEVRITDDGTGQNAGVMDTREAIKKAQEIGFDLILISDKTTPPIAKIMDYGKFQYEQKKKQKEIKAKVHHTETKAVQVKIATGDGALKMKADKASEWLQAGHRIKAELYLVGRAKYSTDDFKKQRLYRLLDLIKEPYKIAEPLKKSPKGVMVTIERDTNPKKEEEKHENK